jgi:tRNA(adenine34) deaminase
MLSYLSDEITHLDLQTWMRAALHEAELAGQAGELPIGAVIVIDGRLIARGRARHNELRSQVRHAEMNAILEGGEALWLDFNRAVLFTTVEPCPMCLGAAVMADIPHIVYALPDRNVQSARTLEHNPYVRRHVRSYTGGVLADESAAVFARYNPQALAYIQTGGG